MNPLPNRRDILSAAALLLLTAAGAGAETAPGPTAILTDIYQRAVRDRRSTGFTFPLAPKDRAAYFSAAMLRRWQAADARTKPGDQGPLDFDPITNAQDNRDLRRFSITSKSESAGAATLDVTLGWAGEARPAADLVVHYSFVLEGGRWKIDDIAGTADGTPWSLRAMIAGA